MAYLYQFDKATRRTRVATKKRSVKADSTFPLSGLVDAEDKRTDDLKVKGKPSTVTHCAETQVST